MGHSCRGLTQGGPRELSLQPQKEFTNSNACLLSQQAHLLIIIAITSSLNHSGCLPSHLFSPCPLWPHQSSFRFLQGRQRSFNKANPIGPFLCLKPSPASCCPQYPWEGNLLVRKCACVYVHSRKGGFTLFEPAPDLSSRSTGHTEGLIYLFIYLFIYL